MASKWSPMLGMTPVSVSKASGLKLLLANARERNPSATSNGINSGKGARNFVHPLSENSFAIDVRSADVHVQRSITSCVGCENSGEALTEPEFTENNALKTNTKTCLERRDFSLRFVYLMCWRAIALTQSLPAQPHPAAPGFLPQRYRPSAWLRSCPQRRLCHRRQSRPRGPCGGPEGLCGPR